MKHAINLVQDDSQIQIGYVVIRLIIFGSHMDISINIKMDILVLIKWSYMPPPQTMLTIAFRMVSKL